MTPRRPAWVAKWMGRLHGEGTCKGQTDWGGGLRRGLYLLLLSGGVLGDLSGELLTGAGCVVWSLKESSAGERGLLWTAIDSQGVESLPGQETRLNPRVLTFQGQAGRRGWKPGMDWWEKPGECVVQEAQGKQCFQKGRERSTESESDAAKMSGFAGFTQKLMADTSMREGWAGRLRCVRIE